MDLLYPSYEKFARSRGERKIKSREALGTFFSGGGDKDARLGTGVRLRTMAIGEHLTDVDKGNGIVRREAAVLMSSDRATGYALGDLEDARKKFTDATKLL